MPLPTRYGRLAIPIFYELAETEFQNSRKITSELTPLIIDQSSQYNINERKAKQLKQDIKRIKESNYKNCLQELILQRNEKKNDSLKSALKKAHQTGSQCCQLLSIVLNYQSSSSGIHLGYVMVGKSQISQHFVHVEVNLTFSTAWAVRKVVL